MSARSTFPPVLLLTVLGVGLAERQVFAYLDPGSGSLLLQVLLGGFAALGVAARLAWRRLRVRFGGTSEPPAQGDTADERTPLSG